MKLQMPRFLQSADGPADIDVPTSENVIHLHRPGETELFAAVKGVNAELRSLVKEGRDLEQKIEECLTRKGNAIAALKERFSEISLHVRPSRVRI